MNEKITFFDDIIDIDTLVTMQLVSSPLIQNLPSHPNSKDYLYDWNLCPLDMTKLEKVILVRDIFLEMNLFKCFNIKEQVFIRFMWEIAYFYTKNKNPFHNFSHSVNVCHAGFYLLKTYPRFSNLLSMEQQFGFIVSCLGHDLDHRGKTNNFEIMTESDLALTYHDTSPLEYHHAAVLFKTLAIKGNNIMHTVKGEAWKSLKKDMLENILATDMKLHFSMLTQFKTQLLENSSFGENPCSDQERKLITNHFIHYCDLSGSFKDFAISTRWSKLVNMEFSNQYSQEESLGIPATPHFKDLNKEDRFYSSEINFIKLIVLPLFDLSNTFMGENMILEKKCVNHNMDTYIQKLKNLENDSENSLSPVSNIKK